MNGETTPWRRVELVACQHCGATTTPDIVAANAHGRHLQQRTNGTWALVNCAGQEIE